MGWSKTPYAVLASTLSLAFGCGQDAFLCGVDSDCGARNGVESGQCEALGYCSFPDATCRSGRRYGDHAQAWTDGCVPGDGGGATAGPKATDSTHTTGFQTSGIGAGSDSSDSSDTGASTQAASSTGLGIEQVEFTDDEYSGEFAAGVFIDTRWYDDGVTLEPGVANGRFVSRVFDAGSDAHWTSLSWLSTAPYGVALPEAQASESGFVADAVDMSDNVWLLHLDVTGNLGDGAQITDSSGRGNHAVVSGALAPGLGVFDAAVDDDDDSYIWASVPPASDLEPGLADFTWSLWVKTDSDCTTQNRVFMGLEEEGQDRTHLWLGCTNPSSHTCATHGGGGFAGGALVSEHDSGDGVRFCGLTDITDGEWHHIAVVKAGTPETQVRLYVDGDNEWTGSGTFTAPLDTSASARMTLGAFRNGSYQAQGTLDEVAMWKRALGPEEIAAIFRRGHLRTRLRIRVCADATCSDAPFRGPSDDPDGFFDLPANALEPGQSLELSQLGRYVQYEVQVFHTGVLAPKIVRDYRLAAVSVTGSTSP